MKGEYGKLQLLFNGAVFIGRSKVISIDIHQVGDQLAVFIFGVTDTKADRPAFHQIDAGHLGFAGGGLGP